VSRMDPGRTLLSTCIPGSHDSASHRRDVITQSGDFTEQLGVGVRYFDVRIMRDGERAGSGRRRGRGPCGSSRAGDGPRCHRGRKPSARGTGWHSRGHSAGATSPQHGSRATICGTSSPTVTSWRTGSAFCGSWVRAIGSSAYG